MDWGAAVDIYCERLDPGFRAEPVNALTNLSFVAAAVWGWRRARRRNAAGADFAVVAGLAVLVGVGSFVFHTVATRWAGLADVVPIGLFCLAYPVVGLRRFFGLGPRHALGLAAVAAALGWAASGALPPWLRGSALYLPALAALAATAAALGAARHPAFAPVAAAAIGFAASLGFRIADAPVCAALPLGTHFLWHLLNGGVFALLFEALIRAGRGRYSGCAPNR